MQKLTTQQTCFRWWSAVSWNSTSLEHYDMVITSVQVASTIQTVITLLIFSSGIALEYNRCQAQSLKLKIFQLTGYTFNLQLQYISRKELCSNN